jgi:hypothetical protein
VILYRSKVDVVDRLQAGDMIEAQDLAMEIISGIFTGPTISIEPGKIYGR